ncbi:MAG: chromosomal replication initiator protein DnaA [Patescibacteria group bacterium]
MSNEELWQNALSEIELNVSRASFATWFKDTCLADINNEGIVTISVPNGFAQEWLGNKYHKFILKSLRTIVPEIRSINYVINASLAKKQEVFEQKNKFKKDEAISSEEQLDFKDFHVDPKTNLNPKYTFDNFIVGSFNDLAYTAALAVIKNLGKAYNPLFIYGGSGLGKTHLLQAIGNSIKKESSQKKVNYMTAEKFSNELVSSIQAGSAHNFKEKYRDCDLLIVDDIQFFEKKIKTQEEFFHTFNTLYDAGKQVIFSSDRAPQSIIDIEERLRSRLQVGVIIDISAPDYETRLAIIKAKCNEKKIALDDKILEIIAGSVQRNIRELEGALNLIHMQSLYKNKIMTPEEAKLILSKNARPKTTVNASQIIKMISEFYDIPEKNMYEKTRKHEIVHPRQIAMYLIREDLSGSFPSIGQKFGGRDHTTAMHAYLKVKEGIKNNPKIEEEIKQIREKYYPK